MKIYVAFFIEDNGTKRVYKIYKTKSSARATLKGHSKYASQYFKSNLRLAECDIDLSNEVPWI